MKLTKVQRLSHTDTWKMGMMIQLSYFFILNKYSKLNIKWYNGLNKYIISKACTIKFSRSKRKME